MDISDIPHEQLQEWKERAKSDWEDAWPTHPNWYLRSTLPEAVVEVIDGKGAGWAWHGTGQGQLGAGCYCDRNEVGRGDGCREGMEKEQGV